MGSSDRTDGGTTARVVGTLLTWMQEKREPVFVVATEPRRNTCAIGGHVLVHQRLVQERVSDLE